MNDERPPNFLYYATVQFEDGRVETPHYLVFDALAEGVLTIKEHFKDTGETLSRLVMKEALYINTKYIPEDTHILIPSNDRGVEDDFKDPLDQQNMVLDAEEGDTEDAIMSVLPYEQDIDDLKCRAFFMGPFLKAQTEEEFVKKLSEDPFEVSQPIDYLWLYRPTGEWKEVKVG